MIAATVATFATTSMRPTRGRGAIRQLPYFASDKQNSSTSAIAVAVGKVRAPPGAFTPRLSTSAAVIFRVPDHGVFVVQIVLTK